MKLPPILQAIADHFSPARETSAPGEHPDLGPGMGQERDDALDEEARQGMVVDAQEGPLAGEQQAAADLDAAINAAREQQGLGPL